MGLLLLKYNHTAVANATGAGWRMAAKYCLAGYSGGRGHSFSHRRAKKCGWTGDMERICAAHKQGCLVAPTGVLLAELWRWKQHVQVQGSVDCEKKAGFSWYKCSFQKSLRFKISLNPYHLAAAERRSSHHNQGRVFSLCRKLKVSEDWDHHGSVPRSSSLSHVKSSLTLYHAGLAGIRARGGKAVSLSISSYMCAYERACYLPELYKDGACIVPLWRAGM